MAGYVMYDRAANPNGAAVVMNREHWRYFSMRDLVCVEAGRGAGEGDLELV
jgi:hypothetical protein